MTTPDIPGELLCRPMGLVVLTGLNITHNAVHKSVWDSFCNHRRAERVPLQFVVFGADHEYAKCRPKRTSYEWYIPKGIVKANWVHKHLNVIPAVVVIFFDLDWDEVLWKEKQMECATRIQIVRGSLQGRGTKVAVVLIQKNAPLPPGEDVVAAERAASLCSACELSAKSLFVLPHTDHLIGYTIRLENAFYELSQGYYHTEARRVKSHKDFLNKTTHQLLFVRHQFKIAFYNELKQDTHTALKHYKQAYGHLIELRMHDTNLMEVKTIAGYVNYKMCRLSFQHNAPLDAIAQFRKHIDFFKAKTGIAELSFEHSAWISKQFQVFGDLFDEAIKLGLTAIQTQHPGFYYQQAANHATARKHLCRGLCRSVEGDVTPDPLEGLHKLDFYGQRPWRQGNQSNEPPDSQKEKDGIVALQNLELKVEHSWLIIPLLSSAVAQFKKYKSPRMKRYLMVQMGEEYYHAQDYGKALTLLSKVTWEYRTEHWWPLLTSILDTSLKCAYLVARVHEYVTLCLELIGRYTTCADEEKTRVQMNLIRVMSNSSPEPEPGLDPVCVDKARSLWSALNVTKEIYTVDMMNIVPFVECKAGFVSDSFTADGDVTLQVCMRTSCHFPLRFSKLSVTLSHQIYNQYCSVTDGQGISAASESDGTKCDLYLIPGQTKIYTFTFRPRRDDIGSQLEVTSIIVELGCESQRCAILRWTGVGGEVVTNHVTSRKPIISRPGAVPDWDNVILVPLTSLIARPAHVTIDLSHDAPSLLNEFYKVDVTLTSEELVPISDVNISFGVQESHESSLEQTTHICVDTPEFGQQVVSKKTGIDVGTLQPGEKVTKTFYIKSLQLGTRTIAAMVMYGITVPILHPETHTTPPQTHTTPPGETHTTPPQYVSCVCSMETHISLVTVTPFEMSVKLTSLAFEPVEVVHADEAFMLMPELKCSSPWQLEIQTSELALSPSLKQPNEFVSQIKGVLLKKSECTSECVCLMAPWSDTLGSYTVHWRRKSCDDDIPFVSNTFTLPHVVVEYIPLQVSVDLPAYGTVKTLLQLMYVLQNKTAYPQELEVSMESNDHFMFAGNKQVHFRVLPSSHYNLYYNLYPLVAGYVSLPKLHVNMVRYQGTMDDVVQRMLPQQIFIKPSTHALTAA